jgi:hypothetical protein
MARFRLMSTHIGPDGRRLKALTVIADSGLFPGDVIWVGLTAAAVSPTMVRLECRCYSLQSYAMQAYGLKPVSRGGPCGVDSIS